MTGLAPGEREDFARDGYLVVRDALGPEKVSRLVAALGDVTGEWPGVAHNVADVLGRHEELLDLVDLPAILPRVRELLGDDIWVNHSHLNVTPSAHDHGGPPAEGYGWHRDGGAINRDLPHPAPLLSIKVGLYLTDLTEAGGGQTYVLPGSHLADRELPGQREMPEGGRPLLVPSGTAVLYDRRLIHTLRSPNRSGTTRRAVFVQYAFRWICAMDAMTVEHLRPRCDSLRLRLLGLDAGTRDVAGAAGRSLRFYPPEARPEPRWGLGALRSLKRRLARRLRR